MRCKRYDSLAYLLFLISTLVGVACHAVPIQIMLVFILENCRLQVYMSQHCYIWSVVGPKCMSVLEGWEQENFGADLTDAVLDSVADLVGFYLEDLSEVSLQHRGVVQPVSQPLWEVLYSCLRRVQAVGEREVVCVTRLLYLVLLTIRGQVWSVITETVFKSKVNYRYKVFIFTIWCSLIRREVVGVYPLLCCYVHI